MRGVSPQIGRGAMYPPFSATSDSPAPGNCSRLRGSHRDPAPGVVEQVGPPGPVIQRHQFGDMRLVVAVVQVAPGQSFGNDKLTRGGGESHDRDRTPTALGVRLQRRRPCARHRDSARGRTPHEQIPGGIAVDLNERSMTHPIAESWTYSSSSGVNVRLVWCAFPSEHKWRTCAPGARMPVQPSGCAACLGHRITEHRQPTSPRRGVAQSAPRPPRVRCTPAATVAGAINADASTGIL